MRLDGGSIRQAEDEEPDTSRTRWSGGMKRAKGYFNMTSSGELIPKARPLHCTQHQTFGREVSAANYVSSLSTSR